MKVRGGVGTSTRDLGFGGARFGLFEVCPVLHLGQAGNRAAPSAGRVWDKNQWATPGRRAAKSTAVCSPVRKQGPGTVKSLGDDLWKIGFEACGVLYRTT